MYIQNSLSPTRIAIRLLMLLLVVSALSWSTAESAENAPSPKATEAASVSARSLAGSWLGALSANGTTLRLALDVNEPGGKLAATLTSIDQGNAKIPVTSIDSDAQGARFECAAIAGSFEGKYSADGTELVGTWKQGPNSLPLTFKLQK